MLQDVTTRMQINTNTNTNSRKNVLPRDIVCLGNMCMDTVHKRDSDDDDDDDDDNNQNP